MGVPQDNPVRSVRKRWNDETMKFFNKKNYFGIGLAIVLLVIGFFLLGQKPADNSLALNVAPFVLLFAYLVVIPWSLWKGAGEDDKAESNANQGV